MSSLPVNLMKNLKMHFSTSGVNPKFRQGESPTSFSSYTPKKELYASINDNKHLFVK